MIFNVLDVFLSMIIFQALAYTYVYTNISQQQKKKKIILGDFLPPGKNKILNMFKHDCWKHLENEKQ